MTPAELEDALNPDLRLFTERMKTHPKEFTQDEYCLVHKSGVQIWTHNEELGVQFYKSVLKDNSFTRKLSKEERKYFWKTYENTQVSIQKRLNRERRAMMREHFAPTPATMKGIKRWKMKLHLIEINLKRVWRILWS